MVTELLQNIGLTKNESKVYSALIKLKIAYVSEIYRESGVPRVNIYDILESLKSKGLVASIIKSNKKYFEPANPDILNKLYNQKIKEVQSTKKIISNLSTLFNQQGNNNEVSLFKGVLGVKTIMEDILSSKTEILDYGSGVYPNKIKYYIKIWEAKRIKNKISMRIVLSDSKKKTTKKEKLQEIRYINQEFKNLTSTIIYDSKVAILIWNESPLGILIDNIETADAYRNYFEVLWKDAN